MITIKNLKYSEFASQETFCFEATVYVDGKRGFIAHNDGHGGSDYYYPVKGQSQEEYRRFIGLAEEFVLTLPKWSIEGVADVFDVTIESHISGLVSAELMRRDYTRGIKKRIYVWTDAGVSYYKTTKVTQALIDQIKAKHPDDIVLNTLPIDEAVALYAGASS